LRRGESNEDTGTSSKHLAEVTFEGEVFWVPHKVHKVPCKIDVTYFPYDIQTCSMMFGSWMYDNSQLSLFPTTQAVNTNN